MEALARCYADLDAERAKFFGVAHRSRACKVARMTAREAADGERRVELEHDGPEAFAHSSGGLTAFSSSIFSMSATRTTTRRPSFDARSFEALIILSIVWISTLNASAAISRDTASFNDGDALGIAVTSTDEVPAAISRAAIARDGARCLCLADYTLGVRPETLPPQRPNIGSGLARVGPGSSHRAMPSPTFDQGASR
jgi:hypothetical protein